MRTACGNMEYRLLAATRTLVVILENYHPDVDGFHRKIRCLFNASLFIYTSSLSHEPRHSCLCDPFTVYYLILDFFIAFVGVF